MSFSKAYNSLKVPHPHTSESFQTEMLAFAVSKLS